jgi:predicted dienelactone hydrolase
VTAAGLALPRPTGPLAVGRDTLHLVDRHRRDPWVPAVARELMVDVYYPARPATGTPARYATAEEIRRYLGAIGLATTLPVQALADTAVASRAGATPLPGRRALVLLSPGLGVGRRSLTGLAEDLASRGLVAATVDHAYESVGTAFPGGRMLTCVACDRLRTDADFGAASRGRAADLSFVLDSLLGSHPAWRGAQIIDPTRIAAVGHSLGGSAAVSVMLHDRRVRAGVDMDGTIGEPIGAGGLDGRALLLLGATADHPGAGDPPVADDDPSWARAWAQLGPPRLWLDVDGADHFSFTDDPVLADQIPLPAAAPSAAQALAGRQALAITRAYVGAFVERWLCGGTQALLDGPSRAYPQVRVVGGDPAPPAAAIATRRR